MGHQSCCVKTCKNTGSNSTCKFYSFPKSIYKIQQRKRWILEVKKINSSKEYEWSPKPYSVICSAHFIGNKKAEEELSPSYFPTIFNLDPLSQTESTKINNIQNRHKRFMKKRFSQRDTSVNKKQKHSAVIEIKQNTVFIKCEVDETQENFPMYEDKGCQVEIINYGIVSEPNSKTFICNRYISSDKSDAEIQTNVSLAKTIVIRSSRLVKHKSCGTLQKEFLDKVVGPNLEFNEPVN